ncbi:MAG: RNase P modulator RnpM [Anaerolineales bacterium]
MTARSRKTPLRTCVVCRRTADKRQLTRLVRSPDGPVRVDPSGKQPGRGAYLCPDPACWHKAIHTDALAKALRTALSADDRARMQAAAPRDETSEDIAT